MTRAHEYGPRERGMVPHIASSISFVIHNKVFSEINLTPSGDHRYMRILQTQPVPRTGGEGGE